MDIRKKLSIRYKFWKVRQRLLHRSPFTDDQDLANFYMVLDDIQTIHRLRDEARHLHNYFHVNGIVPRRWEYLMKPIPTDIIKPISELSKEEKLNLVYDFVKYYHREIITGKKTLQELRQPVDFYSHLANVLIRISRELGDYSNLSHLNWLRRLGVAIHIGED